MPWLRPAKEAHDHDEALRQEMREYIEWAKAILASRCLGEIIAGELH